MNTPYRVGPYRPGAARPTHTRHTKYYKNLAVKKSANFGDNKNGHSTQDQKPKRRYTGSYPNSKKGDNFPLPRVHGVDSRRSEKM